MGSECQQLGTQNASLCFPDVVREVNLFTTFSSDLKEEPGLKQINTDLDKTQLFLAGLDDPFKPCEKEASLVRRVNEGVAAGSAGLDGEDFSNAKFFERPGSAGIENRADQTAVEDMDIVELIECEFLVRSVEKALLGATSLPSIGLQAFNAASLAEPSGNCASNLEWFNSMVDADTSPDADLESYLAAPVVENATVDPNTLDRFLCHAGGFEYQEPGFSCWISLCRCPGDACRNVSPWSPPPTAFERSMCEPSMAGIMRSLIDEARAKEVERRQASAARAAHAAWAAAARTAAIGTAPTAQRNSKRALAGGGVAAGGMSKRGRPCAWC
jgi:hypothetical protein